MPDIVVERKKSFWGGCSTGCLWIVIIVVAIAVYLWLSGSFESKNVNASEGKPQVEKSAENAQPAEKAPVLTPESIEKKYQNLTKPQPVDQVKMKTDSSSNSKDFF